MREILFRGKRDNGDWVEGNLFIPDKPNTPTQICIGTNIVRISYDVIPETIGQYTGLTDKNGKKIFEGDIVKIKDYSNGCALNYEQPTSNWLVKWDEKYARFIIDYMNLLPYKYFNESEIIGNIHDNPELLKGGNEECTEKE